MNTLLALIVFFAAVGLVSIALAPDRDPVLAVLVVLVIAGVAALLAAIGSQYIKANAVISDQLINARPVSRLKNLP